MVITWWMIPIGGIVGFLAYTFYCIVVGIKQGIFSEEISKSKQEWTKFKEESKQEWAKFKEKSKQEWAKSKEKFKQDWAKSDQEFKQNWAEFKEEWANDAWMEIKTIDYHKFPPKDSKKESIAVYKAVPSLLFLLIMSITILGIIGMFITGPFIDDLDHSLLWKVFVFMAFTPTALLILFLVAVFLMGELMFLIILAFEFLVLKCLGLSKDDIPLGGRWIDF